MSFVAVMWISALVAQEAQTQDVPTPTPIEAVKPAQGSATSSSTPSGTAPVSVDVYHRDYEGPKDAREAQYDENLGRALVEKESQYGDLEGSWVVTRSDGQALMSLELRAEHGVADKLAGAWRQLLAGVGLNHSGFVSDITLYDHKLEIDYYEKEAHTPVTLSLKQAQDGSWHGRLKTVSGKNETVIMRRKALNSGL